MDKFATLNITMCVLSSYCLTCGDKLGISFCLIVGVLSLVCGDKKSEKAKSGFTIVNAINK